MTNKKHILIISVFSLFFCCNKVSEKIEIGTDSNIPSSDIKQEVKKDTTYLKLSNETLHGTYYTENIRPEKGFYLKRERPKSDFILYQLNFNEYGQIDFKDLTEFYDCGNGIFSLTNSTYKLKKEGLYEIEFNGDYALESSFKIKAEYKLTENNKGEKFLYLVNILTNNQEPIFAE